MSHYFSDFSNVGDVLRYKESIGLSDKPLLKIPITASLQGAADFLADHHTGVALVENEANELIGIVSERDIIRLIASKGLEATVVSGVEEIVTRELVTCSEQDRLTDVSKRMAALGIRHMIVSSSTDDYLGVVSASDILFFAGNG